MGTGLVRGRVICSAVMAAFGAGLVAIPTVSGGAAQASAVTSGTVVNAPVFTEPLKKVGPINLTAAARNQAKPVGSPAASATGKYRAVDNQILQHAPKGSAPAPAATPTGITSTNVAGERGFSGLGDVQQADTAGGFDLEPPDQGLCAGGGYVMEFINNALTVYDTAGDQLVAPLSSPNAFLQPTTDFFSDPRCYYDAPTKRWFYQEFIVGTVNSSGKDATPSVQFEAVSNTPDPTAGYTIYSWNTTDASTSGCPCFGDYDQLGADDNGIYVATDEFGIATPAYNGPIIYAISKETLETVNQSGIIPRVFGYRLTRDAFGIPYLIAPTSTPPGARFAPNTEYFVESNGNAFSDNHLEVYALHNTSELANPSVTAPTLYRTEVTTESYTFPPDAVQKPGPRPLGRSVQDPEGGLQADFDSAMEPTYVNGHIYAELDTATTTGGNGVDWFILNPTWSGSTFTVTVGHQGRVAVNNVSLLYPYTALDASGVGYLLFSLSGPGYYPSPGYISYNIDGPTGPVHIATPGAAPEDGFTCYAAFVGPSYGGCRWGDYSMGVAAGGRIWMATEYIPPSYRDTLANWGTFIWSAPPPIPAG